MLNLKLELQKKGISMKAYAGFLKLSEKTIQNKINGITEFTFAEARKTREMLFPEFTSEYLFSERLQDDKAG